MNIEPFDPLVAFFAWWMNGIRSGLPPSVHDGITRIGDYTGLILYRQPPFQVELWILPPNIEPTEHSHPNVDIFLVHVTGEIKVWVGEDLVLGPVDTVPDKNGVSKANGRYVRLPPGQLHRAGTGPLGGAFMNIQYWLDGNPRSTDSDWKGAALNEEHKKKLERPVIREYVRSLRENSGCCTKERGNTSPKAPPSVEPEVPFPEVSTQEPLTLRGTPLSDPGEERSGRVSAVEK